MCASAWQHHNLAQNGLARASPSAHVACSWEYRVQLQIPFDAGNGAENAGLPLALLLQHLSPAAFLALIEALLLERRIIMVAQARMQF